MGDVIEVYAFEDAEGEPATDWTTRDYREATKYAAEHGYRLIARQYEYTDSVLIEDYTRAVDEEVDEEGGDDGHE